jgi:FMN reductase
MLLVLSCSLNPNSRSRILAKRANEQLLAAGQETRFVNLADYQLPLCNDSDCYSTESVIQLQTWIQEARGILIATPVYNYGASAATKNLIELTGKAWSEKVVGFLCAAGGKGSYMSLMGLANSLMLDFHCLIIPRFVYVTKEAFSDGVLEDAEIKERLDEVLEKLVHLSQISGRF